MVAARHWVPHFSQPAAPAGMAVMEAPAVLHVVVILAIAALLTARLLLWPLLPAARPWDGLISSAMRLIACLLLLAGAVGVWAAAQDEDAQRVRARRCKGGPRFARR